MKKYPSALIVITLVLCLFIIKTVVDWQRKGALRYVHFIIDYPGATDRHASFTPVLASDPSVVLGPTVGADYGKINFRDCDGDGLHEAVIETEEWFETGEYKASVRHVYKAVTVNNKLSVKLISTELLPENDPEWLERKIDQGASNRFCAP